MANSTQRGRLLYAVRAAEAKSNDPTRHKCFISYHADDADEVAAFVEAFGAAFIPRVIGVSDADDFIDSDDTDYVMDQIREKHLTDSTVTIVAVGACTWARRYIDWEISSTLRDDSKNRRSGLMGVTLPSVAAVPRRTPPRLADNLKGANNSEGYARWWKYPTSESQLRGYIDDAYLARTSRSELIDNSRARKINNSTCP
jgi:hypothetical protein